MSGSEVNAPVDDLLRASPQKALQRMKHIMEVTKGGRNLPFRSRRWPLDTRELQGTVRQPLRAVAQSDHLGSYLEGKAEPGFSLSV